MSYIYKITNSINDKIYIGSTSLDLDARFQYHIDRAAAFDIISSSKLHAAIYFIGAKNFKIELVEECSDDQVLEREQYYITTLNTLDPNGYNERNSKKYVNKTDKDSKYEAEVLDLFLNQRISITRIAHKLHIDHRRVKRILEKNGHETGANGAATKIVYAFPVSIRDPKTNEILYKFENQYDAAKFIMDTNPTMKTTYDVILKAIRYACLKKQGNVGPKVKTAYGYVWSKDGMSLYEQRQLRLKEESSPDKK